MVAIIALVIAIFAGAFWRRADVVFDERAVEIPLSDPLRKSIENALERGFKTSDSVTVAKNGKPIASSASLPSTKLPDKLLYVNIRNVGHVPSGRVKVRIVVPGEIADKELKDAGSAFGSIDQRAESDSNGELSFECSNLANHSGARIKVALWYQQSKSGTPVVEIQDTSLGPAREVGSIDGARFFWWDWSGRGATFLGAAVGLLGALLGRFFGAKPNQSRPNFTAIYDPRRCGWAEGRIGDDPVMQVFATASISTTGEQPIEIVQAYLKGTHATSNLYQPLVASRESAIEETIQFSVQPVVVKVGEPYRGHIILVDKNNNRYESAEVLLPCRGSAVVSGTPS